MGKAVLVIWNRSSAPCTVSGLASGGPNDASPMSGSCVVSSGTDNTSPTDSGENSL